LLDHKATFLSAQSAHQVITRLTSGKKQPISYKRLASSLHGLSVRGAQFNKWMMITICEQKRPPRLPFLSQAHPIHALPVYCFKIHLYIILQSRAGQLQPTGGPHNSLRTHMRVTVVYTYTERGK